MNPVHHPERIDWICQEPINIKEFINRLVSHYNVLEQEIVIAPDCFLDDIEAEFDLSKRDCNKLSKRCSVNRLAIAEDVDFFFQPRGPFRVSNHTGLKTLNNQRKHLEKLYSSRMYQQTAWKKQKYRNTFTNLKQDKQINLLRLSQTDQEMDENERTTEEAVQMESEVAMEETDEANDEQRIENEQTEESSAVSEEDQTALVSRSPPTNDSYLNHNFLSIASPYVPSFSALPLAVIYIQIFSPMVDSSCNSFRRSPSIKEYAVLSNQPLTVIRDAHRCMSDVLSPIDSSESPDIQDSLNKADDYTSSSMFISNVFYNDMRKITNIDYSETIRNWASEPYRGIGPFGTAKMEETRFEDLTIQLGYPYLYFHQGNCEHLLVFKDVRLYDWRIDPPLDQNLKAYPQMVGTVSKLNYFCNLCDLNSARWIVFGNNRLPSSPFFFCQCCFFAFNYDKNKQKIGDFIAYPYVDDSALI